MITMWMPQPWPIPERWQRDDEPEDVYMDGELVARFENRYWAAAFSTVLASVRRADLPLCAFCELPMFPWDELSEELKAHLGCLIDDAVDQAKERELDRL